MRVESTVNPEMKKPVPGLELGVLAEWEKWLVLSEIVYSSGDSASGNLKIDYQTFEWNQWVYYELGPKEVTFTPFLGVGLGLSRDYVETTLAGSTRKDRSRVFFNQGVAAGLVSQITPRLDVICELRAWKFEQKKDPMGSGLFALRIGF